MIESENTSSLDLQKNKDLNQTYEFSLQTIEDPIDRFELARKHAFLGSTNAINFLVEAYQHGNGVEGDVSKVFEWLKKGAEGVDGSKFYFELAQAYRNGCGVDFSPNEFWVWMRKAADDGDTEAMFELANAHRDEILGQYSPEKSLYWTEKMANAGSPSAMIELAKHYKDNDLNDAESWAKKAVEEAGKRWVIKKNQINSVHRTDDFIMNDYPMALEILSEILLKKGEPKESKNKKNELFILIKDIVNFIDENKEYEMDLWIPVCLAEILKELSDGIKRKNAYSKYFESFEFLERALVLFKAGTKFKDIYKNQSSLNIASVIHHAASLKDENSEKKRLLELAADFGCSTSAYDLAMLFLNEKENEKFEDFINRSADLNSMKAIITHSLMEVDGLKKDKGFPIIQKLLINLWEKICEIKNKMHVFQSCDDRESVAHYTDEHALVNMLSSKNCIRLYNIAYMNDPNEGKRLQSYQKNKNFNPLDKIFPKRDDIISLSWRGKDFHIFIGCFSLESDKLNLWRFYGRDGKGFSVTTPLLSFNSKKKESMMDGLWSAKKAESSITLYKILYTDSDVERTLKALKQPINKLLKEAKKFDQKDEILEIAAMIVRDLLYLYKLEDYKDEREVRVIEARALGDSEIKSQPNGQSKFSKLYIETPAILFQSKGSKIILGPKVENAGVAMVDIRHQLAAKEWSGECTVEQSKVPYR